MSSKQGGVVCQRCYCRCVEAIGRTLCNAGIACAVYPNWPLYDVSSLAHKCREQRGNETREQQQGRSYTIARTVLTGASCPKRSSP